jgi:PAS domain S-box-containing protein
MTNFLAPLPPEYTLQIPQSMTALVGWMIWSAILVYLTVRFRDRKFRFDRGSLAWLALLSILILAFTPFLGAAVKSGFSGFAEAGSHPHLMILAALPWLAAGGILGLVPAVLLAGLSGVLLGYLDTHHIFTSLLFMSAALTFTFSIRQKYGGFNSKLLRNPLVAAMASAVVVAPLTFIALLLNANGDLASRTLSALSQFPSEYISLSGMLLIGGAVCIVVKVVIGSQWGASEQTPETPVIQNLGFKFAIISLPLAFILLFVLIANQWSNAEDEVRRSLVQEMTEAVTGAAESLPEFIEAGEQSIKQMAGSPELLNAVSENVQSVLETSLASNTFYDQIAYINPGGELLGAYPLSNGQEANPTSEEEIAIDQVVVDREIQPSSVVVFETGSSARLSFFAPIIGPNAEITGVLMGRVGLTNTPSLEPLFRAMSALSAAGGEMQVVDGSGRIIFHTNPDQESTAYNGSSFYTATYFETIDENGLRNLEYYLPISSLGWAVVASVPVKSIQLQAIQEITPLLTAGMAVIVLVAGVAVLMFAQIDRDVNQLVEETSKLSRGEFDSLNHKKSYSSGMKGLGDAFQVMRGNLKSRLQTQSELLSVSERITGQLKLRDSLQIILMAALEHGISSARIVLLEESQPSSAISDEQKFGTGRDTHALSPLDEDVLTVTRVRGQWIMRNVQIDKNFHLAKGMPELALMVSIPLRWRNKLLGTFWLASDRHSELSDEELSYFTDLAQKAATAVINSKAFDETLTIRKRLEAVLAKLDDPVVITDNDQQVIYVNDAIKRLLGLDRGDLVSQPLNELMSDEGWVALLSEPIITPQSKEIQAADGCVYLLTIEPIGVDGRQIGLACIFKDITQFKQRDDLKTEFVTTVSHELRSPLTLIHGYAKILRLTGNLNDQQETYISSIIDCVDEMKNLVQNLLDLGRMDAGDALEIKEISVGEIAKQVMDTMGTQARQKDIEIELSLPEAPVFIEVDPIFLVQAVKNLVDNAIKYSRQGGSVHLQVRKQADSVLFSIRDNGPGIAPLDQRKIFKRFFRSESQVGVNERSGSGLGLAIVKSIAERHGGKVWFESKLGKGSSFYLQIPLLQRKK